MLKRNTCFSSRPYVNFLRVVLDCHICIMCIQNNLLIEVENQLNIIPHNHIKYYFSRLSFFACWLVDCWKFHCCLYCYLTEFSNGFESIWFNPTELKFWLFFPKLKCNSNLIKFLWYLNRFIHEKTVKMFSYWKEKPCQFPTASYSLPILFSSLFMINIFSCHTKIFLSEKLP